VSDDRHPDWYALTSRTIVIVGAWVSTFFLADDVDRWWWGPYLILLFAIGWTAGDCFNDITRALRQKKAHR
jgi:hypothetical protein